MLHSQEIKSLKLNPDLEEHFLNVLKEIGDDRYDTHDTLGIYAVLKAHYLIAQFFYAEEGVGGVGPRDLNLLHSALYRQFAGYGDFRKHTDMYEIAATLLFGLVQDHPFYDANKRTAFLSVVFYFYERSYVPDVRHKVFEEFLVHVASGGLKNYKDYKKLQKGGEHDPEIILIAKKLKSFFRKVDNRPYTITFRELNTLLHKYDFWLDDAKRNRISVFRKKKKKFLSRFIGKNSQEENERVTRVGFPGWSREVSKGDLRQILVACKLDADHGIDSQSFFFDRDTMQELINDYQGLLKRLAYK